MLNFNRKNNMKVSIISDAFYNIKISEFAYMQMSYYIKNCSIEVGWLASVQRNGNTFEISECFLLEQDAHGATCELKEEALNNFAMDLIQNGQVELYESIKCWCHSHVNMGVSPSSQDNEQMKLFGDNDWFIRGIGNKSGEMKFDIFDFKNGITIEDVKWEIKRTAEVEYKIKCLQEELKILTTFEDIHLENEIKGEIKTKVNTIILNQPKYYNGYNSIYGHKAYDWEFEDKKKEEPKKKETKSIKGKENVLDKESVFEYFYYDEIMNTYAELGYNYNLMQDYLMETLGIYDIQAVHEMIEELDYEVMIENRYSY